MAKVVNRRTASGQYAYIGRPSIFGNPFTMRNYTDDERARVIAKFEDYFYNRLETDPAFKEAVMQLKGHDLGCYCAPKPCHGDIILNYLERH